MYTTCAFCNARLDGDGGPSGLGVGRRLAFDEWRGRLWVICPSCARWNLTPFDDRLERLEGVARAARDGRVAAATDHVALIKWGAYDFVRVGKPPRVELAGWRYGERLRARERERMRVVVPLTVVAVGAVIAANVAAGGSLGVFIWNFGRLADGAYVALVGNRRVILSEPPVCEACGAVMHLRARHLQHGRLVNERGVDLALIVRCPVCNAEGAELTGADASRALRRGLTYVNAKRGARRRAGDAAADVDRSGGPDQLVREVSRREVPLRSLAPTRRLALEIAVDELSEITELERRWREAEETAAIADGTLSTAPDLEARLHDLHARQGTDQPNG